VCVVLLIAAAFTGNAVNYAIGRLIGPRVFAATDRSGLIHRLLNREHLLRAHTFFEQYGGKAIIMGRFVPIVRTFVPFVAGAAAMKSHTFVLVNFIGAVAWVVLCVGAGLLFGNVPIVKENFSLVVIGIVAVSLLPMAIEIIRTKTRGH
jgi:membrane-associated protein